MGTTKLAFDVASMRSAGRRFVASGRRQLRRHRLDRGGAVRARSRCHAWAAELVVSKFFKGSIIAAIVLNTLAIALETTTWSIDYSQAFIVADLVFMCCYTVEAVLKIYVEPMGYWESGFNLFDFALLQIAYLQYLDFAMAAVGTHSTFLRVLRGFRALRALRGVGAIRSLQVIIHAFGTTMRKVLDLLFLLCMLMYIFAIMGFYFFGWSASGQPVAGAADWGSIPRAFMSLFVYVTADGWTRLQDNLDQGGYDVAGLGNLSRLFSVLFMIMGHFIFINLFIGVVIQNIDDANTQERDHKVAEREQQFSKKKRATLAAQESTLHRKLTKGDLEAPSDEDESDEDQAQEDYAAELQLAAGKAEADAEFADAVVLQHPLMHTYWQSTFSHVLERRERLLEARWQTHMRVAAVLTELVENEDAAAKLAAEAAEKEEPEALATLSAQRKSGAAGKLSLAAPEVPEAVLAMRQAIAASEVPQRYARHDAPVPVVDGTTVDDAADSVAPVLGEHGELLEPPQDPAEKEDAVKLLGALYSRASAADDRDDLLERMAKGKEARRLKRQDSWADEAEPPGYMGPKKKPNQ